MKRKIVILGGGVAGLATAFELTSQPDWRDHTESITLYQMGWRLGGKCASGRGANKRIEEHGIHLFGGGYYNGLAMMVRCYDELHKTGGWPLKFEEAFLRQSFSVGWEGPLSQRKRTATDAPRNELGPADGHKLPTIKSWVVRIIKLVKELFKRNFSEGAPLSGVFLKGLAWDQPQYDQVFGQLQELQDLFTAEIVNPIAVDQRLREARQWLGERLRPMSVDDVEWKLGWRQAYLFAEFAWAVVNGVTWDIFIRRRTFDELDEERDYAAWLNRFGASDEAIALSVAQSPLRILYQYPEGDQSRPPSMGAGTYLHWMLRTMAYLETPFWLFAAGTGETVIAPLYEVLKRRGVQFKFFHKVEALHLSGDGSTVASVNIGVQATLKAPRTEYEPLEPVRHLQCWRAEPDYAQLNEGDDLQKGAINLESYWSGWTPSAQLTLTEGADYDSLVFAISLGAVPYLCAELVHRKSRWRDLVDHVKVVQTQSFQIWLNETSDDLGVDIHPIEKDDTTLSCGYQAPFDGLSDFSPLLRREQWPPGPPRAIWYFSDVLLRNEPTPSPGYNPDYPKRQNDRVEIMAMNFLDRHMEPLLPDACRRGAFDYSHLTLHTANGSTGKSRFAQQWWIANVEPSELYVQAPANTTRFRMKAWESGCRNLVLAGDWTYNGLNVGCVEAAITSGLLASHAIAGYPALNTIMGYQPRIS